MPKWCRNHPRCDSSGQVSQCAQKKQREAGIAKEDWLCESCYQKERAAEKGEPTRPRTLDAFATQPWSLAHALPVLPIAGEEVVERAEPQPAIAAAARQAAAFHKASRGAVADQALAEQGRTREELAVVAQLEEQLPALEGLGVHAFGVPQQRMPMPGMDSSRWDRRGDHAVSRPFHYACLCHKLYCHGLEACCGACRAQPALSSDPCKSSTVPCPAPPARRPSTRRRAPRCATWMQVGTDRMGIRL